MRCHRRFDLKLLFLVLLNFASLIRSFFSSFFCASNLLSSSFLIRPFSLNFSASDANEFRKCCCMAANGFATKEGCCRTRPMCVISALANAFFALLVLCNGILDLLHLLSSLMLLVDSFDLECRFDVTASLRASRIASKPSIFPFCSSRRCKRSDESTIFSLLRYCSRLASRFFCPRLRTTSSFSFGKCVSSPVLVATEVVVVVVVVPSFFLCWGTISDESGAPFTSRDEALEAERNLPT